MDAYWNSLKKTISDHSMSIMLFGLFLLCLAGQGLSGWLAYKQSLQAGHFRGDRLRRLFGHRRLPRRHVQQLAGGGAAVGGADRLWLGASPEGRGAFPQAEAATIGRSSGTGGCGRRRRNGSTPTRCRWRFSACSPRPSCCIVLFGEKKYNEDQALRHLPPISLGSYAGSSSFWFSVFQCWEAEFLAIGTYIILSIFLGQENSPEWNPGWMRAMNRPGA